MTLIYDYRYRQIILQSRNYEWMLQIHFGEYKKDLKYHDLWNDFCEDYSTEKTEKEIHDQWNEPRKKSLDKLIHNGQILNWYLIKSKFITTEYLKLIAWGYSPLPPHLLTKDSI